MRVYLFSPIPYSFLRQRPQQIADELVRQSVSVTFIEPFGLTEVFAGRKRLRPGDPFRSVFYHLIALRDLLFGPPHSNRHAEIGRGGLEILTFPFVLPSNRIDSSLLDRVNSALFRAWLRRTVLGRPGCAQQDVALVQQPYLGSVIRRGDFARIYYDCIDEPGVFSGHGSRDRLILAEEALLSAADGAFVTAAKLEDRIRAHAPALPVTRVPNGVPLDEFRKLAETEPEPEELAGVTGPIAGYIGILRAWFDYDLILQLAREMPAVTIVLVGPYETNDRTKALTALPNVRMTGRTPYRRIPAFVRRFDIGLIPFLPGEIAESTNPVKLFEYFALGKPVASTPLREVMPFSERGLVAVAVREHFVSAVRREIDRNDAALAARRLDAAREHSWEHLVRTIRREVKAEVPG